MTDATQSVNFTAYFQNIEPSITVIAAVIAVVISIIGGLFSFIK
jgi:hypothetical protein